MKDATVKDRILQFIDYLGISAREFCRTINASPAYVKTMRRSIGTDKVQVIREKYPNLNINWLLYGEDDMLINGNDKQQTTLINKPNVYDASTFSCGFPGGESEAITQSSMEKVMVIPGAPDDVFYVRAHGNSMVCQDTHLSIPDGAYVALRKKCTSYIQWGEVYALATRDGMLIKKVMPSDDESFVKCVSFNKEEYPEFQVRKQDIIDMAIVVGVIAMKWKMA